MDNFLKGTSRTQTTDSTQQRNPFAAAAPGISQILGGATGLQPVVPTQSADTQAGLAELRRRAGLPSVGAEAGAFGRDVLGGTSGQTALGTLESTAAGEGLQGNPFLQELVQRNSDRTVDLINSRFSGIGQRGGPANQEAIADALARGELSVFADNFQQERNRQQQAATGLLGTNLATAQSAAGLDQSGLFGANTLLGAGGIQDQFDLAQQNAPFQNLQRQASLVNPIASAFGIQSGNQTQESGSQAGLGQTLIGLGLAGGSLFGGGGLGGIGQAVNPFVTTATRG